MEDILKGLITIMVTAREESGEVSTSRIKNHIQFLKDNGMVKDNGAILVTGSIGECATLTMEERIEVWKASVEAANNEVPIIAGINHTNPDEVIEMSKQAKIAGADLVMIMSPYYWKPSERSVRDFFIKIIKNTHLPIFLYNNIPATQIDLPLDLLSELAEYDEVVGLKECTPNFVKFERVYNKLHDKISVINGNGEFWEPYAAVLGSKGFVSGLVNFAPKKSIDILHARNNGDYAKVFEIKAELEPYFDYFNKITSKYGMSVEIDLLKAAANIVGSEVGPSKPPVTLLTQDEKEELKDALKDSNLI
jgi:dihydrodipicolinate synthase/N-acetylneuraminate lyase